MPLGTRIFARVKGCTYSHTVKGSSALTISQISLWFYCLWAHWSNEDRPLFFFLFSPFLPSNFLRDIKNCVGIQFFSNDSGQDISNTHKFCLSSRIFLGYILFLPWYINDSTVTTRCWISQQKITDEQLYIQKQQTLYNIDANVWVIFEYIAHLKNCFFSGPCQRT